MKRQASGESGSLAFARAVTGNSAGKGEPAAVGKGAFAIQGKGKRKWDATEKRASLRTPREGLRHAGWQKEEEGAKSGVAKKEGAGYNKKISGRR